jgi:acyl dehydratase
VRRLARNGVKSAALAASRWIVPRAGFFSLVDRWRRGNRMVDGEAATNGRACFAMDQAVFSRPRYFEDFPVGSIFEFGSVTVTDAEIIAFARQFDPQTMHTDPAAAARGPTGGLIASGWHTTALLMRLYADHILPEDGLPAPGVDELRWLLPVRPGDTLSMRVTIEEARVSKSKPDRGIIRPFSELLNQRGEVVLSMRPINIIRRRP